MIAPTHTPPLGLEDHMIKSSFLLLPLRVPTRGKLKQKDAMGTSERLPHSPVHLSLCGLLGDPLWYSHTQPAVRHALQFWLLISQTPFSLPSIFPSTCPPIAPTHPAAQMSPQVGQGSLVLHPDWLSLPGSQGL